MFTRREKVILGIFVAAFIAIVLIVLINPDIINNPAMEYVYYLIVVVPVGVLLISDKERAGRDHHGDL